MTFEPSEEVRQIERKAVGGSYEEWLRDRPDVKIRAAKIIDFVNARECVLRSLVLWTLFKEKMDRLNYEVMKYLVLFGKIQQFHDQQSGKVWLKTATPTVKTYLIRCTATTTIERLVDAESKHEAIKKAEKLCGPDERGARYIEPFDDFEPSYDYWQSNCKILYGGPLSPEAEEYKPVY